MNKFPAVCLVLSTLCLLAVVAAQVLEMLEYYMI